MKSFMTVVGSVAVLLTSVSALPTTNIPRQTDSCFIRLKNGDGDASVGASIPVDALFSTADNRRVSAGVNAQAVTPGCVCQGFSDAAGTLKLGGIFDDQTLVSFTDASSGEVDSHIGQAVPIGSFCCVSTPNTAPICSDDSAVQIEVPADGSPFAVSFDIADAAEVVDTEGSNIATCQAFSDADGTATVGSHFGTDLVSLNGGAAVRILSLRCNSTS
ncbi:hypothetical protein CCMA1212_009883 [Trichoderma ghanense]|uniref:SSCRP protein n=1 Tax=Trichoderma ghanense TaxID=65468 RepID=A0ABY2GR22_9HYPO